MENFALQTRKTSQNHDYFIKNQAKSLIFHGFLCQNFPTVGSQQPPCLLELQTDRSLRVFNRFRCPWTQNPLPFTKQTR